MAYKSIICCPKLQPTSAASKSNELHFTSFCSFATDSDSDNLVGLGEAAKDNTSAADIRDYASKLSPLNDEKRNPEEGDRVSFVVQLTNSTAMPNGTLVGVGPARYWYAYEQDQQCRYLEAKREDAGLNGFQRRGAEREYQCGVHGKAFTVKFLMRSEGGLK